VLKFSLYKIIDVRPGVEVLIIVGKQSYILEI